MQKIEHLIVGFGEVGKAVHAILKGGIHDTLKGFECEAKSNVLHICFPYFKGFVKEVKKYQKKFEPKLTIIHSTVPLGTSKKCNAVHSPIRGVHPHLEEGIRTFVKYFGGKDAKKAAKIFSDVGITTSVVRDSRTTEALKLWDTNQYGVFILLNKEIYAWCKKHKVDFDVVYTSANETYNDGYSKLGRHDVMRPVLKYMEGPIGGHCVVQNAKLLISRSSLAIEKYKK